ncbi:amino acid aminotransferase [Pseudoruegeria sp. HB172150]|uniref:amino acid aminotransferase n=1 Tax=Pseudoruegeria sp. HB172150 TaxID=2721164 RepID=UPI00155791C3|nr:amino acid aminotransferase [Pseudoruegeria sp. HB172150]
MLQDLTPQPKDKILMLMEMFKEDPREQKVDLGVGVYKNAQGVTPVMRAIKTAEEHLWETETTKTYTGLAGDPAFTGGMRDLVLDGVVPADRVAAAATPGGTGAVHQAFDLVRMASPEARIWVSDPTWPNHLSILKHLDIPFSAYRYFDNETRAVDFEGMLADLKTVNAGDVVLLHGCCHNPTGANLTLPQWKEVAQILNERGAIPMIDIAYQGFGDGIEADAAGTRHIVSTCPEAMIAASCSKNFGIYRERTGVLMAIQPDASKTATAQGTLNHLNRQNFSFPPDHGARLVSMILADDALKADWMAELEEMRKSMLANREALAAELRRLTGSDRFGFIAQHRGMFSRIGATPEQVVEMREKHGIYMVGDSRMNIAGLNDESIRVLAKAIADVGV